MHCAALRHTTTLSKSHTSTSMCQYARKITFGHGFWCCPKCTNTYYSVACIWLANANQLHRFIRNRKQIVDIFLSNNRTDCTRSETHNIFCYCWCVAAVFFFIHSFFLCCCCLQTSILIVITCLSYWATAVALGLARLLLFSFSATVRALPLLRLNQLDNHFCNNNIDEKCCLNITVANTICACNMFYRWSNCKCKIMMVRAARKTEKEIRSYSTRRTIQFFFR